MTNVIVHEEVQHYYENGWHLCFQRATWNHDDRTEDGYRFIWRDPEGRLKPSRGQAIIYDAATLQTLIGAATRAGWFH